MTCLHPATFDASVPSVVLQQHINKEHINGPLCTDPLYYQLSFGNKSSDGQEIVIVKSGQNRNPTSRP